ncbi:MAG: transglutaminase family protein [Planctomycetes bacterium]|nr:transglutaminase family protein [Planctomycetota bacterium]
MRKFVILLLVFVLSPCGFGFTDLANEGKDGLRIRPIDRILRMDESQIDLCTAALVLSNEWGSPKTLHRYRNKVDKMAEEILDRLEKKRLTPNQMAIPVINDYLYKELGFETVATADDPEDLFLHTVLDKRRGYCLSLSVLYLSIAERIGMPLYGVVVPGHFFVRYDDGKN